MEIPKNLEECYLILEKSQDIEEWLKESEGMAMAQAHHGIGMWIRNNWGLWKEEGELFNWFKENEINHPDDMSGIILTSFYRYKNNLDIKLDEQINESVEWYLTEQERLLRQRNKPVDMSKFPGCYDFASLYPTVMTDFTKDSKFMAELKRAERKIKLERLNIIYVLERTRRNIRRTRNNT